MSEKKLARRQNKQRKMSAMLSLAQDCDDPSNIMSTPSTHEQVTNELGSSSFVRAR